MASSPLGSTSGQGSWSGAGEPARVRPHRSRLEDPSVDDPALAREDLAALGIILGDEALEGVARQEPVRLRRALDVILPLRRLADLLEDALVIRDRVGRNAAGQPDRARHL